MPGRQAQHRPARGRQRDPVAHGHVHRTDVVPGAQGRADHLPAVAQRHEGATAASRLGVLSHQAALGAAEGGEIEQHAQVACQAEAARMGAAVAVAEEQVGPRTQPGQGLEQRRDLPKRQVAGHVGEARQGPRPGRLHHGQALRLQHHHGGEEHGTAAVVGDVGARHQARLGGLVPGQHARAETLLPGPGLGHREVEGMRDPRAQAGAAPEGAGRDRQSSPWKAACTSAACSSRWIRGDPVAVLALARRPA
jgi:hypothetical protein